LNNVVLNSDGSVGGELGDTLAAKLPYSYGTATPSTTTDGFLWYDENDTPPTPKFWDGSAFQALTSGKILQVVRATDGTTRSTTSQTFVDVSGMSVTITPQKSDSAIIVLGFGLFLTSWTEGVTFDGRAWLQLTDSSNNSLSGAQGHLLGILNVEGRASNSLNFYTAIPLIGYSTPATTSAVTYKMRMRAQGSSTTVSVRNADSTGQMYAIEVSA